MYGEITMSKYYLKNIKGVLNKYTISEVRDKSLYKNYYKNKIINMSSNNNLKKKYAAGNIYNFPKLKYDWCSAMICWKGYDNGKLSGFVLELNNNIKGETYFVGFSAPTDNPFNPNMLEEKNLIVQNILKHKGIKHTDLVIEKNNKELAILKVKIILKDYGWDIGSFIGD